MAGTAFRIILAAMDTAQAARPQLKIRNPAERSSERVDTAHRAAAHPEAVTRLDWRNDMSDLLLDMHERIERPPMIAPAA